MVAYGFNLSKVVYHPQAVVYRQQWDLMLRINMEFLRNAQEGKENFVIFAHVNKINLVNFAEQVRKINIDHNGSI
jgi:hypothetical protein